MNHLSLLKINYPIVSMSSSHIKTLLVQQPAYYAPPVQNQHIYPSRYFRPRSQNFRPRMSSTAPRQQFNRNIRQPISFPRQTSVRTCLYCNGFCQTRAQCPASDVVCHLCNRLGHFSRACPSSKRLKTQ